jgi:hypothetical protein
VAGSLIPPPHSPSVYTTVVWRTATIAYYHSGHVFGKSCHVGAGLPAPAHHTLGVARSVMLFTPCLP